MRFLTLASSTWTRPAQYWPGSTGSKSSTAKAHPPGALLEELRGLVQAAEAWAKLEGDERARTAVERCDTALAQPVA